jgi:DNA-3-methyladenine glycosylase II
MARAVRGRAHLHRADPVLAKLIDAVDAQGGVAPRSGRGHAPDDHYGALLRSIVGQQLSTRAAASIYGRLLERFGGRPPTPRDLLEASSGDPEPFRASVGLSRAKVKYLRSLAEHVIDGSLDLERMASLPDDQVIAELTAIKGLGLWTSQMFLMFHLGREDVLPVGDLGIRRAIERAYALPAMPDADEMAAIAGPWRPYRSLASRYLWRSLDNEPL